MRSSFIATITLLASLVECQSPKLYFAGGPTVATVDHTDLWSYTGYNMANTVTAYLLEGPPTNLQLVMTITQITGGTFTWAPPTTLTPNMDYAFEIADSTATNYLGPLSIVQNANYVAPSTTSTSMSSTSASLTATPPTYPTATTTSSSSTVDVPSYVPSYIPSDVSSTSSSSTSSVPDSSTSSTSTSMSTSSLATSSSTGFSTTSSSSVTSSSGTSSTSSGSQSSSTSFSTSVTSSASTTTSSITTSSTTTSSTTTSPTTTSSSSSVPTPTTTSTQNQSQSSSASKSTTSSSSSGSSTSSSTTSSASSSQTSGVNNTNSLVGVPSTIGNYGYLGCYTALVNSTPLLSTSMYGGYPNPSTLESCIQACYLAKHATAGMIGGQQCWCGDALSAGTPPNGRVIESNCNSKCAGNATEYCGGIGTGNMPYANTYSTNPSDCFYNMTTGSGVSCIPHMYIAPGPSSITSLSSTSTTLSTSSSSSSFSSYTSFMPSGTYGPSNPASYVPAMGGGGSSTGDNGGGYLTTDSNGQTCRATHIVVTTHATVVTTQATATVEPVAKTSSSGMTSAGQIGVAIPSYNSAQYSFPPSAMYAQAPSGYSAIY